MCQVDTFLFWIIIVLRRIMGPRCLVCDVMLAASVMPSGMKNQHGTTAKLPFCVMRIIIFWVVSLPDLAWVTLIGFNMFPVSMPWARVIARGLNATVAWCNEIPSVKLDMAGASPPRCNPVGSCHAKSWKLLKMIQSVLGACGCVKEPQGLISLWIGPLSFSKAQRHIPHPYLMCDHPRHRSHLACCKINFESCFLQVPCQHPCWVRAVCNTLLKQLYRDAFCLDAWQDIGSSYHGPLSLWHKQRNACSCMHVQTSDGPSDR